MLKFVWGFRGCCFLLFFVWGGGGGGAVSIHANISALGPVST